MSALDTQRSLNSNGMGERSAVRRSQHLSRRGDEIGLFVENKESVSQVMEQCRGAKPEDSRQYDRVHNYRMFLEGVKQASFAETLDIV